MRKRYQIYKCEICGNIVEVLHGGVGTMICCNKPMTLQVEKTEDPGLEKHVPVVEEIENGIKVRVGSVPHPMEEDHYIEWIEIISEDVIERKYLQPTDPPEAIFIAPVNELLVREFCTVHGLWRK